MEENREKVAPQAVDRKDGNRLRVEIIQHRSLLDILGTPGKVFKIVAAMLVIVFTIFVGLALVTITVKRIYPYNDIRTNPMGATTMQNEERELIYWLFNTADLWGSSDVEVKQGDVLTVRASGKSHTSIHHLVEDARGNNLLRDTWVGTEGTFDRPDSRIRRRNMLRSGYRIFPDEPQDALIMQVVPHSYTGGKGSGRRSDKRSHYLHSRPEFLDVALDDDQKRAHESRFYLIGRERVNLRIAQEGILHFAVNDIVLTRAVIAGMLKDNERMIADRWRSMRASVLDAVRRHPCDSLDPHRQAARLFSDSCKRLGVDLNALLDDNDHAELSDLFRAGSAQRDTLPEVIWKALNPVYFAFGAHPDGPCTREKNEMTYYRDNGYCNAWFDDNVGSFLIVIERNRKK